MQADVLNIEGKKTGRTVELPEEILNVCLHFVYFFYFRKVLSQPLNFRKVLNFSKVIFE